MRAARVLRNAAADAAKAATGGTPKPMSADHKLYHYSPEGFWKKFHDVLVVNPEISSGNPLQSMNRMPPPASRPERYATPATRADDVAFNPYWQRDARRAYPRTSVVTQPELSALLIAAPALQSVAGPASDSTAITADNAPALTSVIDKMPAGRAFVARGINTASADARPPLPPGSLPGGKKWKPRAGEHIPRPTHAYFPISGYN